MLKRNEYEAQKKTQVGFPSHKMETYNDDDGIVIALLACPPSMHIMSSTPDVQLLVFGFQFSQITNFSDTHQFPLLFTVTRLGTDRE